MTRWTLVLLLLLVAAPAAAAALPSATRYRLANGLTLLVRENAAAPVVAVSLQVRAGSHFEPPDRVGITNFLLRVMVRGTGKRSAVEFAQAAEELGGSVQASGEVETAEIRAQALARHWETLLGLVADVVLDPAMAPGEIERERRIVLSRIQARADSPFPLSLDTLLRELYGGHPYGSQSLGTKASLERLGREALLAHYRGIFRADRMVLAVSGQVPSERVVKLAERLFGRLKPAGDALAEPASPSTPAGGRRMLERPAQQAQILVGYLGPGLLDPSYPALRVLGTVLGGGMAGRLFVELRDRRGLAYSLGALAPYWTGPTYLVTHLSTARPNVAAAEAAMLEELERIRAEPVGEDELTRAKAYLLGRLALDRRTNARHAWYMAFFEAVGAGWDFAERYARAIEAVTVADVTRVAGYCLARPTIVLLVPPER